MAATVPCAPLLFHRSMWYVQNMNVQKLNEEGQERPDTYKSLMLLDEISKGEPLSQRDLSKRLGIALGLVNSYMKNLVAKGYITVKTIPAKRYAYYLTPKGFTEKTRLTYHLLQDYTRIYREARTNLKRLFKAMSDSGARRVVFAGVDEVAEIAYLTLQETNLELTGVVDEEKAGEIFFGKMIRPLEELTEMDYDCVVITSYLKRERLLRDLREDGVDERMVRVIFPL